MRKRIRETINRYFHRSDKKKNFRRAIHTRGLRYECLDQRQLLSISPSIGSLSVSPYPTVDRPAEITLTANYVQAYGESAYISQVTFYRDSNYNGELDLSGLNQDQLLGTAEEGCAKHT